MPQESPVVRIVGIKAVVDEDDAAAANFGKISYEIINPCVVDTFSPSVDDKCKLITCVASLGVDTLIRE